MLSEYFNLIRMIKTDGITKGDQMATATKSVIIAEVTKIHDINERITYYEFSVDLDYGLTYVPGQFLMLIMVMC